MDIVKVLAIPAAAEREPPESFTPATPVSAGLLDPQVTDLTRPRCLSDVIEQYNWH